MLCVVRTRHGRKRDNMKMAGLEARLHLDLLRPAEIAHNGLHHKAWERGGNVLRQYMFTSSYRPINHVIKGTAGIRRLLSSASLPVRAQAVQAPMVAMPLHTLEVRGGHHYQGPVRRLRLFQRGSESFTLELWNLPQLSCS